MAFLADPVVRGWLVLAAKIKRTPPPSTSSCLPLRRSAAAHQAALSRSAASSHLRLHYSSPTNPGSFETSNNPIGATMKTTMWIYPKNDGCHRHVQERSEFRTPSTPSCHLIRIYTIPNHASL